MVLGKVRPWDYVQLGFIDYFWCGPSSRPLTVDEEGVMKTRKRVVALPGRQRRRSSLDTGRSPVIVEVDGDGDLEVSISHVDCVSWDSSTFDVADLSTLDRGPGLP